MAAVPAPHCKRAATSHDWSPTSLVLLTEPVAGVMRHVSTERRLRYSTDAPIRGVKLTSHIFPQIRPEGNDHSSTDARRHTSCKSGSHTIRANQCSDTMRVIMSVTHPCKSWPDPNPGIMARHYPGNQWPMVAPS